MDAETGERERAPDLLPRHIRQDVESGKIHDGEQTVDIAANLSKVHQAIVPKAPNSRRTSTAEDLDKDDTKPRPEPMRRRLARLEPAQSRSDVNLQATRRSIDADEIDILPQEAQATDDTDLELVVHYRYDVAPSLDLGIGSLFFGIAVPIEATNNKALSHAMLALSAMRKPEVESSAKAVDHMKLAGNYISTSANADPAALALLGWCRSLELQPESWLDAIRPTLLQCQSSTPVRSEVWQVLARLAISALLFSQGPANDLVLPAFDHCEPWQNWNSLLVQSPHVQHCQSLSLLLRCLAFLPSQLDQQRKTNFPLLSAWQACWSEIQVWYSLRTQDIRQILEISSNDHADPVSQDSAGHPTVIFSNACALHSNVCHHLAAVILLQNKPRLARPIAEAESSISIIWHALRIVGIIAHSSDSACWDGVVAAALTAAAQVVSHDVQRHHIVQSLRQVGRATGLNLDTVASQLEGVRHT